MNNIGSTLATVWRIAAPYFRSEDRWAGRALLAAVITIELAIVGITVLLNQWNARFYNALQERNWDSFVYEIIYFSVLAAIYTLIAVYQLYLNQWLQIRWRRWMTAQYLGEWLHQANHYRMQLQGDAADNPDQRMTDDVKLFVERTLNIGVGLLSSIVTLASFVVILWGLSNAAPLHLFGRDFAIPGYLVWGALIYSVLGTVLTHLIGWPLVGIDFRQQRYEADFRFNLVRVRENSEQIALLRGEAAERERLLARFGRVVENWLAIMTRTKKLTAFTASYSQASVIFPYILVAPAYFAEKIQLGGMMQTASAFSSVQGALSFFVNIYRQLAEWQAVLESSRRVRGRDCRGKPACQPRRQDSRHRGGRRRRHRPQGAGCASAERNAAGDRGRIQSAQGRAHAAHRPVGFGQIDAVPGYRRHLAVRGGLDRHSGEGDLDDAAAAAVLPGRIAARSGRVSRPAKGRSRPLRSAMRSNRWDCPSSPRSSTNTATGTGRSRSASSSASDSPARCCTRRNTCSSMKPPRRSMSPLRRRCIVCSQEKLPATTIVSIGHRSTLDAFHQRNVVLTRDGDRFALLNRGRESHAVVTDRALDSRRPRIIASAAATAGAGSAGARHRRTRSAVPRLPAPARTGTSRAGYWKPPAADRSRPAGEMCR